MPTIGHIHDNIEIKSDKKALVMIFSSLLVMTHYNCHCIQLCRDHPNLSSRTSRNSPRIFIAGPALHPTTLHLSTFQKFPQQILHIFTCSRIKKSACSCFNSLFQLSWPATRKKIRLQYSTIYLYRHVTPEKEHTLSPESLCPSPWASCALQLQERLENVKHKTMQLLWVTKQEATLSSTVIQLSLWCGSWYRMDKYCSNTHWRLRWGS